MARFLAVFWERKSGGKKIGEREGFQLIEVIWKVPKTGRECQKFSFWQNGDIFGRIFGRGTDIFGILGQVFGRLQM